MGRTTDSLGRLRRLPAAALALLALAVNGCGDGAGTIESVDPGSHRPVVHSGYYGVNAQYVHSFSDEGREALVERHLGTIAELGFDFVRADVGWRSAEPDPPVGDSHSIAFGPLDRWVRALAGHGLAWQALMVGTPTPAWAADPSAAASCGSQTPPARASDLAEFSRAFAARYGRGGKFWDENSGLPEKPVVEYEVWNEPNFGAFWCPQPNPAAYADLYAAVADAVHGVDPRARVLVGGLVAFRDSVAPAGQPARMDARTFLRQMLGARPELGTKIDGIAIHDYEADAEATLDTVSWYRDVAREVGLGEVPMSLNEVGWYTQGDIGLPPTPEEERAGYLERLAEDLPRTDCGVSSLVPYAWATPESDPADAFDWYGIAAPATAEPYQSAIAYSNAAKVMKGEAAPAPPREPLAVCAG